MFAKASHRRNLRRFGVELLHRHSEATPLTSRRPTSRRRTDAETSPGHQTPSQAKRAIAVKETAAAGSLEHLHYKYRSRSTYSRTDSGRRRHPMAS